ncbi:unnamed protein product (macronuclear) [Paramecium tetraurelia]|uniref:Serine/threonine-protein phosphatase 4 regulatory subunit 3-like central domain-containing protein n=1 Tax=Paramecium tetraurelia TaxID=5888 RepID=A0BUW2_PARTE|nr:uncharacterized protein GSPATT00005575001 [Paramecium tetraurelia]CAK62329.1 unnamed protein product [Paramecium tetraurelia]|eukprot:XP_001429727.1 hypothetical protein (macronuclear) [Paramecium tetraurelia strain d4-2]
MFNFARFFGFGFQSKLDNLLKQENLTLETILNEEDILQELKMSSSEKFADFIISHPNEYQKMIHYIIDEVEPQEQDINTYIKYQFIISEVFSSENEKLINYLFDKQSENTQEDIQNPLEDSQPDLVPTQEQLNKELIRQHLLDDFLVVLEKDALIITTAGYVNKIIGAIIHKRGHDFWEYIIKNQNIISNLFKHAALRHITEIIEKLIILDTNQEENEEKHFLKERAELIIRLQKFLTSNSHSNVIISNVCDIFIELYKRELQTIDTTPHLRTILPNVPSPQYLMNLAIQTQNTSVYNLLNIQFEFYTKIEVLEDGKQAVDLKQLYSSVISQLPSALIQQDIFKVAFQTSKGDQVYPLGDSKLSLISFIIQLCQTEEIAKEITQAIIFQNILNLTLKYPSNNQLQILFEKLVITVLQSKVSYLQKLLFQDQLLLKFLMQYNGIQERKQKPLYQGILTKITNYLNSNINQSEELANSIDQIKEEWQKYIDELNEINQKELQWMLGVNPRMKEQINSGSSSPFRPDPLISYQGIRNVENNDDNPINQQQNDDAEVQENLNNEIQSEDQDEQIQYDALQISTHETSNNKVQSDDKEEQIQQDTIQIASINQNQFDDNQQVLEQHQEIQVPGILTENINLQLEVIQTELIPEPEPTELIDQQQQQHQQNSKNDEQENQQELCEPEPQQQNQFQNQEPQEEPDGSQQLLESNPQVQEDN